MTAPWQEKVKFKEVCTAHLCTANSHPDCTGLISVTENLIEL
jgi:hypothetical protein